MDFDLNAFSLLNVLAQMPVHPIDPVTGVAVPRVDQRGWQVLSVMILGSVTAQILKVIIKLLTTRKLDLRVVATTGGMPSSHSAATVGMATTVGFIESFNSVSFAIALSFAIIVMYDAAGVRRSVGLQARVVNRMIEEMFSEHPHISSERIKEFLGHTPKEVIVGAILGVLIAFAFNAWAYPRLIH